MAVFESGTENVRMSAFLKEGRRTDIVSDETSGEKAALTCRDKKRPDETSGQSSGQLLISPDELRAELDHRITSALAEQSEKSPRPWRLTDLGRLFVRPTSTPPTQGETNTMSMDELQADQTAVAVVTALINGDEETAATLVLELTEDQDTAMIAIDRLTAACLTMAKTLAKVVSIASGNQVTPAETWQKYALAVARVGTEDK